MLQHKFQYMMSIVFAGAGLLASCERDNGEVIPVSEFGAVKTEYVVGWHSGTSQVEILSNQQFEVSLLNPDNGWLRIDDLQPGAELSGDSKFNVGYTTNDGFPRMEGILVQAGQRADTVYFKQEGYRVPELKFETQSIAVAGDGGEMTARLATNLYLDEIDRTVTYTSGSEEEWISDFNLENGFFIMQFASNPDPEALRRASVTLTYTDGWGETSATTTPRIKPMRICLTKEPPSKKGMARCMRVRCSLADINASFLFLYFAAGQVKLRRLFTP